MIIISDSYKLKFIKNHFNRTLMGFYIKKRVLILLYFGTFDVVTMRHVLEHVPAPNQTLNQIHQVLTFYGRIVIAVPDIGSWLFKWLGKDWYPLDLPHHFKHFDKVKIGNILSKNDFKKTIIFGQHHGQATQQSMRYLLREKNTFLIRLIALSRSICSRIKALNNMTGNYSRMIVHAEKKIALYAV